MKIWYNHRDSFTNQRERMGFFFFLEVLGKVNMNLQENLWESNHDVRLGKGLLHKETKKGERLNFTILTFKTSVW